MEGLSSTSRRGSSEGPREERVIEVERWTEREALKDIFKAYYDMDPPLVLPMDMARREFAIQPFEIDSYVRHLSFGDEHALRRFIKSKVPRHLYHSVGIYEIPGASSMEDKGWLGSELLFDLDLDHPGTCESELVDDECLVKGFEKAKVVARVISDMLGGKPLIYFTGHRGFHVRGLCSGCLSLGRDERLEIAKLVRAEGLDVSLLFPSKKGVRPAAPSPSDPGWRGLAASLGIDLRATSEDVGVDIDVMVTQDPSRLTRVPGSLNAKGGMIVTPLCDSFTPGPHLSPFRGSLDVKAIKALDQTSVMGFKVSLSNGEELSLPASVALYLYLSGYVTITGGEVVVRRNTGWWPIQGCDWTP
ncbi:DNA primase small subunit PriS [Acidilobus sp. 7A]|uniref:DNA primase small subunit PriS n=1 Tax=Acidilobus sp. 7A TaxID=1577685 RepID=UPI000764D489|nr:DNA primase small subunit PriS [Acidilobus sp. 7A]AMD30335.1 DNA primase small subunit [Acidilobus sp. 7A]